MREYLPLSWSIVSSSVVVYLHTTLRLGHAANHSEVVNQHHSPSITTCANYLILIEFGGCAVCLLDSILAYLF